MCVLVNWSKNTTSRNISFFLTPVSLSVLIVLVTICYCYVSLSGHCVGICVCVCVNKFLTAGNTERTEDPYWPKGCVQCIICMFV